MLPGKQAAPSLLVVAVLLVVGISGVFGEARADPAQSVAIIGLIVDDLGNHRDGGQRVARLPGPIACSVLPHTPYATELASLCHEMGKVVMLHLPMQPAARGIIGGPGLLHEGMAHDQLVRALHSGLDSVPYARGVNNHMGSHLTRHLAYMQWVMEDIVSQGGLFFVDSHTSVSSVALKVARANGIPSIGRDVFLDNDPDPRKIRQQFQRLVRIARKDGYALGIGHPYKATLDLLEAELPQLAAEGVMLVSVEDLIGRASVVGKGEKKRWQANISPSPAVLRKSKRESRSSP
jgi:polysaccharide deacetylase 2 family uncharacterized protein YibQ